MNLTRLAAACGWLFLGAGADRARAQAAVSWDPRGAEMTRRELDSLLSRLNRASESQAYSQTLRARSRAEAALVKERLVTGDFQVGDRILLRVEGEPALSDTFLVGSERLLPLPIAGDVPLAGILRSELPPFLTRYLGEYLRDPVVHARTLVRLSVVGGVARPGFYLVPADTPLPDVLMLAGGPSGDVNLRDVRIERGRERLWEGESLQLATNSGRTVDQLNLRAGDQIVVPRRGGGNVEGTVRTMSIIITMVGALYGITRIF